MSRGPRATVLCLLVGFLLLTSCTPPTVQPSEPTLPAEDEICTDQETGAQLSLEQALQIAENSECTQEGQLKDTHFCNSNTGTWWIDLDIDKPGCAPACVVDVDTLTAQINWRCTGALPPSQDVLQSDKARLTSPDVSLDDLTELASGNSQFAFNLYQAIRSTEGNIFFSPYSISAALAMTYAGARGETAQQMAKTLSFTLPQERLHPAFNALDLTLTQRGEDATGRDQQGFRLNIVNAIWGQTGYSFLPDFLDTLAQNYGAGLRLLDFAQAPDESRLTINDWVAQQTEARIKDLIPQGLIDPLTRLVLTNAIYFNAAWQYPFEEEQTHDAPFYLLDGDEVTVPMMTKTESFGYATGDGYQAVELPYEGLELSMVILLPDPGQFETVEALLNGGQAHDILEEIRSTSVAFTMPKFEFDADLSLGDALQAMGMTDAFSGAADFSGMTGERDLFISNVLHKAFVAVDEAGTEAAAATAVIMKRLGLPEEPITVVADRPFLFWIRDIETGTILFLGRVVRPDA